jgi:hypothetical protein
VESVDLGVISGKVGVSSSAVVLLPMGVEERVGMKVCLSSSVAGVGLAGFRGRGEHVEVTIGLESRRHGGGTFEVECMGKGKSVIGKGRVVFDFGDPIVVEIKAVLGGKGSASVPLQEVIWQTKSFLACFEPPVRGLSVSSNRGELQAGAEVFPFKVIYAPTSPKPVESRLVVDLGDVEVVALVRGSTCGFRKHGA